MGNLVIGVLLLAVSAIASFAEESDAGRVAEERFLKVLAGVKVPERTVTGKPIEWTVAVKSDLLPQVRVYKYVNRYPSSVIVDAGQQEVVKTFDATVMTEWIRVSKVACDAAGKAQVLAEFYTQVVNEPYSANQLRSVVTESDGAFAVECTYVRTTVWSPPGAAAIAGSKTAKYRMQCVVKRDGTFESREPQEIEIISTRP